MYKQCAADHLKFESTGWLKKLILFSLGGEE